MKVSGLPNTTAITVAGNGLQNFTGQITETIKLEILLRLSLISSSLEIFPWHIILQALMKKVAFVEFR